MMLVHFTQTLPGGDLHRYRKFHVGSAVLEPQKNPPSRQVRRAYMRSKGW